MAERAAPERRNSCRNSAKRTAWRMVGLRDGLLLLLAQRALQDDWARQHSRRDMARHLTDHQDPLARRLSTSQLPRKASQEYISLEKTLKGISLGYVLRACGGWSGDLLIANYEVLHDQKPLMFTLKRFESQEVFVKGENGFSCANGTLRLPDRPTPSLIAGGNLEPEDDEEGDKQGRKQEIRGLRVEN